MENEWRSKLTGERKMGRRLWGETVWGGGEMEEEDSGEKDGWERKITVGWKGGRGREVRRGKV